jgi:hypothetical protein
MRWNRRRRLGLESLESREMLASSASIVSGALMVSSDVASVLLIKQTAANAWSVTDNGNPVGAGTFSGVTGNVIIQTSANDDQVTVDLQNNTAPRSIQANLGDGINQFSILNGTVRQNVLLYGGAGNDTVDLANVKVGPATSLMLGNGDNTVHINSGNYGSMYVGTGTGDDAVVLGDGVSATKFSSAVTFVDGGGLNDSLVMKDKTTIGMFYLQTVAVNNVQLDAGSKIYGSLYVSGGFNVANSLTVNNEITGFGTFTGSGGVDTVNFGSTAKFGKAVLVDLKGGSDVANLQGTYCTTLNVNAGLGDDTVSIDGTVAASVVALLGDGNDLFSIAAKVGTAPTLLNRLVVDAGKGNDQVAVRAAAVINGRLDIKLGDGDDSFSLDDAAFVVGAKIDGGIGTDTYYGTRPRTNVTDLAFEAFLAGPPPF